VVARGYASATGLAIRLVARTLNTFHNKRVPDAPDDNATRVLDQSRRCIEDSDKTVANSSTPLEMIDVMHANCPAGGNRYTLFAAAFTQFPAS
jgi:hypothetical protein